MKLINIIRFLLNLIIFLPLIVISISYFVMIDKHLMANLYGIIIYLLTVPLINIAIEFMICKRNSRFSKSSIAIILSNIVVLIMDYKVAALIGGMF